jgi:hypothetical protein
LITTRDGSASSSCFRSTRLREFACFHIKFNIFETHFQLLVFTRQFDVLRHMGTQVASEHYNNMPLKHRMTKKPHQPNAGQNERKTQIKRIKSEDVQLCTISPEISSRILSTSDITGGEMTEGTDDGDETGY